MIPKIWKFRDFQTYQAFVQSTIFLLTVMIAIRYSPNFPMAKVKYQLLWFLSKNIFLVKENSLKRKRCSNQSPSKKRSRTQSVSLRNKRWFRVAFIVTRLTRTTTPEPKIKRYITADDLFEARDNPSYQITLSFISQNINSQ